MTYKFSGRKEWAFTATRDELHKAKFDVQPWNGPGQNVMTCPICGCGNVHLDEVAINTDISTGNQGNVYLSFYGECEHTWGRLFDGHKGELVEADVLITSVPATLPPYNV